MLKVFAFVVLLLMPLVVFAEPSRGGIVGRVNVAQTGMGSAVVAAASVEPTLSEIAAEVGRVKVANNFVWVLLAGFLVMFMQAGFAFCETGFTRAKNAAHTMAMNMMVYGIGLLGYWACGYALQMGGVGPLATLGNGGPAASEYTITIAGHAFGLFGTTGFFLGGEAYDVSVFALFLFSMVFMDTAATIPTGAMAERWKWGSFVVYALFMSMLIYPIFGNWVWGGGWLAQLGKDFGLGHGHVDFAGSSVVHMVGGVAALAGARILGPRIGKYEANGRVNAIPGHDMPMAILGVLILAFGWFGFNAGSTLSGGDLRIAVVAVNTMLGSAAGAVSAMIAINYLRGKPDLSFMANGMLAGLVAVTGPCAFINSTGAVLIGLIAGILLVGATIFVEHRLKIDDPVGAISVHGVNGAWGVIAVGLFADGTYGTGLNGVAGGVRGLFYGGGMGQLTAEIIGAVACIAFTFTAFHVFFNIVGFLVGNRVSEMVEIEGLDIGEIGVQAYPEFLPVVPVVTTAEPEVIPVAASSAVPILDESLAVG